MVATVLIAIVNLYGHGFQVFTFDCKQCYVRLTEYFLQHVFVTTPIPGMYWGIPITFGLGILLADETRKLVVRRYPKVRRVVFYFTRMC
jgi:sodium/potassium-transporting ATPase subunit alpha